MKGCEKMGHSDMGNLERRVGRDFVVSTMRVNLNLNFTPHDTPTATVSDVVARSARGS